jgi:ABC-type nitrate/sulfonate/bicarbonate transport system substrate-binding protein
MIRTVAFATFLTAGPLLAQEQVTVSLDWTPNTNHIGIYVAKARGYYADAGLSINILPYADVASSTLVANGVADFGVLTSLGFFTQRAAGADLIATFAVVQKETGRLVFDAARDDIQRPADLDGLTYAGFGTGWEEALISTMIRADGGEGRFENITLGTAAYEALAAGRVDFTMEVSIWEGVNAELQGRAQRAFRYADYGIPDQHTTFIGTREAWLQENPETAHAFLSATQRGYTFAAENPQVAAGILIEATRGMLENDELVRASMDAIVAGGYFSSETGEVGIIDGRKIDAIGAFLFESGILRDDRGDQLEMKPDFSKWFTNEFLSHGR